MKYKIVCSKCKNKMEIPKDNSDGLVFYCDKCLRKVYIPYANKKSGKKLLPAGIG